MFVDEKVRYALFAMELSEDDLLLQQQLEVFRGDGDSELDIDQSFEELGTSAQQWKQLRKVRDDSWLVNVRSEIDSIASATFASLRPPAPIERVSSWIRNVGAMNVLRNLTGPQFAVHETRGATHLNGKAPDVSLTMVNSVPTPLTIVMFGMFQRPENMNDESRWKMYTNAKNILAAQVGRQQLICFLTDLHHVEFFCVQHDGVVLWCQDLLVAEATSAELSNAVDSSHFTEQYPDLQTQSNQNKLIGQPARGLLRLRLLLSVEATHEKLHTFIPLDERLSNTNIAELTQHIACGRTSVVAAVRLKTAIESSDHAVIKLVSSMCLDELRNEVKMLRHLDGSEFVPQVLEQLCTDHLLGIVIRPQAQRPARETDILRQNVLSQLLKALFWAHQRGIAHRDIRPPNILICDNDHVILADWGCAAMIGSEQSASGALAYASTKVLLAYQTHTLYELHRADDLISVIHLLASCLYIPVRDGIIDTYGEAMALLRLWTRFDSHPIWKPLIETADSNSLIVSENLYQQFAMQLGLFTIDLSQ